MSTGELPSNMGKKIADALKKQSKTTKQETVDVVGSLQDAIEEDFEDAVSHADNKYLSEFDSRLKNEKTDFDDLDLYASPSPDQQSEDYAPIFKMESGDISDNPDFKLNIDTEDDSEEFEMPNNINVLKRLIAQLPTGVSKQTGAQIIRQTIEALGIPMKSVLQDAQKVKECLNSSIKDCGFTIQEYKSNIKTLEKQSLSYQRQLTKLNDIIGLFVYNEK